MKHSIKIEKLSSLGCLRLRSLGLVFMIFLILPTLLLAQSGWSINSSFQMTEGDYITGISRNNYYFNIGSRYRSESWYLSATISFIAQDGIFSEDYSSDMMGGSSTPHLEMGIGDLFLFGEVNLLNGTDVLPWIALSSQVKIPTASSNYSFGTGEFDYGVGLTFRKRLFSFIAFGDIGYLNLGDTDEITFLNPFTYGFGIGKGFDYGKYSISMYYQRYTKIYETYAAPHQLSLGLYVNIINRTFLSFIGSKGLSETSPNLSISAGLEYYL
jgi:hypothetical protein